MPKNKNSFLTEMLKAQDNRLDIQYLELHDDEISFANAKNID